jgi:signal peptidase II
VTPQPIARRSSLALIVMVVSLVLYTFLDLASKEWALDALSAARRGESPAVCEPDPQGYVHMQRVPAPAREVVPGYLGFHYAENCGAAFGMLRTAPAWVRALVFGVAGLGACVVLTTMFMRGAGGPLFAGAVPLILSGAIGNLSDRVRHGFVVDFIQVDPAWFEYPTFNVADIAIAVGVGLLLLDGVKSPKGAEAPGGEPTST